MFVFQFAQKNIEQQAFVTRTMTGREAQELIRKGVAPVAEQMLLKIHGV